MTNVTNFMIEMIIYIFSSSKMTKLRCKICSLRSKTCETNPLYASHNVHTCSNSMIGEKIKVSGPHNNHPGPVTMDYTQSNDSPNHFFTTEYHIFEQLQKQ